MTYKGWKRDIFGWYNPNWRPDADLDLYRPGGFYDTHGSVQMANIVCRSIKEIGADRYFRPGVRVLDYGCGTGELITSLQATGATVEGYDPITRPEMPDGLFDVITCVHVIEHVAEWSNFMIRLSSKIKSGGILILVCHNCIMFPNKRVRQPWHIYAYSFKTLKMIFPELLEIEKRLTWGGSNARPRILKEAINKLRKRLNIGDVQMIIARKI